MAERPTKKPDRRCLSVCLSVCLCNATLKRVLQPLLQGKAISTTYSECVFVALGIQHAMRNGHTVFCGIAGFTVFSHITL
jgi:hypothetical protein